MAATLTAMTYLVNNSHTLTTNESNDSSRQGEATAASISVITLGHLAVLLVFMALPGFALNVFQILAMTSDSKFHNMYVIHYTLAAANIAMSSWLITHLLHSVVVYHLHALEPITCYVDTATFLLSYVISFSATCILAAVHIKRWRDEPGPVRAYTLKLAACVIPLATLVTCVIIGVNIAHDVCYNIPVYRATPKPPTWLILVNLLIPVAHLAVSLAFAITLSVKLTAFKRHSDSREHAVFVVSVNDEPVRDTDCGQQYDDSTCAAGSDVVSNSRSRESVTRSASPKTITFQCAADRPPADSDDDDDDSFDKRMRMRMRKPNSGRRHTVANIGMDDGLLGGKRRSSLEVPQRSPLANFSRKWSVDIHAIQAQLENPRHYTGSFPFNDLGILPEPPSSSKQVKFPSRELHTELTSHTEEDEHEDGDDAQATTATTPAAESKQLLKHGSDKTHTTRHQAADTGDTNNASHNKKAGANSNNNHSNVANDVKAKNDKTTAATASTTINDNHVTPVTWEGKLQSTSGDNDAAYLADDEQTPPSEQLDPPNRAKKYALRRKQAQFFLCSALCLLPYLLAQVALSVVLLCGGGGGGDGQGERRVSSTVYNTVNMAVSWCAVVAVLQPLCLLRAEPRLRRAWRSLWHSQWRCACYCNIGRDKKFFSKPSQLKNGAGTS